MPYALKLHLQVKRSCRSQPVPVSCGCPGFAATWKRINLIAAKMSGNLGDANKMVFKLCDGTEDTLVYAVVAAYHVTPENEAKVSAPYGAILEIKSVLVRHNSKHDAYKVLVSRNTGIVAVK